MIYTFIAERCSDLPVSVCCRVMKVSTSGYYQRRAEPVTDAELAEAHRANIVFDIWKMQPPLLRDAPDPQRVPPRPPRGHLPDHHRPPDGHLWGGGHPLPPPRWLHPTR